MESLGVYLHSTQSVLLLQCKANKEKGVCCLTVYRPQVFFGVLFFFGLLKYQDGRNFWKPVIMFSLFQC